MSPNWYQLWESPKETQLRTELGFANLTVVVASKKVKESTSFWERRTVWDGEIHFGEELDDICGDFVV